ncbi:MAG: hypothetical protein QM781_15840 [Chitinophagaceae bacterium]
MLGQLQQYFLQNRQLYLPGIGLLRLEQAAAELDFGNKQIVAPRQSIRLHAGVQQPERRLFSWLAGVLLVTERDAVIRFNDFVYGLKERIQKGEKLNWPGVGIFSKGLAGEIRFETAVMDQPLGQPVSAQKVMRENSAHLVRVGEEERTAAEMKEWLQAEPERKSWWLTIGIILVILLFIFIGYYFSVHGVNTRSAGNQQSLKPAQAAPAYQTPR